MVVAAAVPTGIALWPRPPRVEAMLAARPFTIAHRGGSADWPEQSQYSYQQASEAGVDALEMSVGRSSDGVWFGCHDKTLDRTSGTTGFVVAEHTWAEIQRHEIKPPDGHSHQPARPYWRLDDLIESYRKHHAIWVDPKAVDPKHYPELIDVMSAHVRVLKDVFVAKSDATNTVWAKIARVHEMQTWGFYYDSDLNQDPQLFKRTERPWTMLGLNWDASAQWWHRFAADGRPVVAHVLAEKSQRTQSLSRGAHGLMIAGVTEVLG